MLLSLALIACGDEEGGPAAVDLTKWLPAGASFYSSVDVAALREDLGLPEDAGLFDEDLNDFTSLTLGRFSLVADTPIASALKLGDVWAAAHSEGPDPGVTVLSTEADTGEVGSALGDLGYRERDGILEPSDGEGPTVTLEEGLIYVADVASQLRDLPSEPAEELPSELMDELDAPVISISPPPDCALAFAFSSEADGSGEMIYLVDGGADARRAPADDDGIMFGEPDVDGDLITIPVDSEGPSIAAFDALDLFATYDCG